MTHSRTSRSKQSSALVYAGALTASSGDLAETLTQLGRKYVAFVSSDDIVRRFRVIVSEAERSPEMSRALLVALRVALFPVVAAARGIAWVEETVSPGRVYQNQK